MTPTRLQRLRAMPFLIFASVFGLACLLSVKMGILEAQLMIHKELADLKYLIEPAIARLLLDPPPPPPPEHSPATSPGTSATGGLGWFCDLPYPSPVLVAFASVGFVAECIAIITMRRLHIRRKAREAALAAQHAAQLQAILAQIPLNLVALVQAAFETAVLAQARALQAAQAADANILEERQDAGGHAPGLPQDEGAA